MTLDDLYAAYAEAYGNSLRFLMVDGAAEDRAHRAGIEAVVRSLLPTLIQVHWAGYHDALTGVDPNVSSDYCAYKINEILGTEGELP